MKIHNRSTKLSEFTEYEIYINKNVVSSLKIQRIILEPFFLNKKKKIAKGSINLFTVRAIVSSSIYTLCPLYEHYAPQLDDRVATAVYLVSSVSVALR